MKAETPIKKWAEDMSAMNQKKKKKSKWPITYYKRNQTSPKS